MIKKNRYLLLGILVLLIVWQLFTIHADKIYIFPSPAATFKELVYQLSSADIYLAALETAWKVLAALALAILIGLPAGYLIGISDKAYDAIRPIMMFIQAVPVISWLTIVIFTWGVGWKGPVFIAFLTLFPNAAFTTANGVRNIDRRLLEMADVYRVPQAKIFQSIYLRSLIPFVITILDLSIGLAWKVILVTEYLCGGKGLGVEILMARMNVDFSATWALTLLAVTLGLVTERIIKQFMKKGRRLA